MVVTSCVGRFGSDRTLGRPVVVMENVSKSFRRKRVLNRINLTVACGEFVSIMGKSGAGKSTLLNLIGLLDRADEGYLALFGESAPRTGSSKARALLQQKLGYLFQNAALIDQDTAEANLKVAQKYSKTPKAQRACERQSALSAVGLKGMGQQKVYELSGGEQQRLAVACLMVRSSELVLADEPTGSLDPENRDAVLSLLRAFNKQGKTVIVVTHDAAVAGVTDRTIHL